MEWIVILCVIGAVIAIVAFISMIYNSLVKRRNKVKNSWAHIDAQLQRRFDLIPNLVETVKGFAEYEQSILDNVAETRAEYINALTKTEKITVNEHLTSNLKSLYVITENYPELKSNANFLQLQSALTEIEEDISYARQFYNDAVTIYNNKLMIFPNNMIASIFNFKEELLFDAVKEADVAPKVSFEKKPNLKYTQCPVCGATATNDNASCEYCGCSLV